MPPYEIPDEPMVRYVSSMIGEISEDIYNAIDLPYEEYIETFRQLSRPRRRRIRIPAILWVEKNLPGERIGTELYRELASYGFPRSAAVRGAITSLCVNDRDAVATLVERGREDDDISYTLTYEERLKEANILEGTCYLDEMFWVRPIKIVEFICRAQVTQTKHNYSSKKKPNRKMDIEMRIWKQSRDMITEEESLEEWEDAKRLVSDFPYSDLGALMDAFDDPGVEREIVPLIEALGELETWHGRIRFYVRATGDSYTYDVYSGQRI